MSAHADLREGAPVKDPFQNEYTVNSGGADPPLFFGPGPQEITLKSNFNSVQSVLHQV